VKVRSHYCRIANTSLKNCIYWAEKYTNVKDIQSILEDEGVEIEKYRCNDDSDDVSEVDHDDDDDDDDDDDNESEFDSADDIPLRPK
jgi:hypothetical protein